MKRFTDFLRNRYFLVITGLVLGALIVLAIRFATYTAPPQTHYHANFAVYLNGQREQFKDPSYYVDEAACDETGKIQPLERAHIHDNINSVIHVHDDGVTWGQFFENLGWYVGPDFVQTRSGTLYKADDTNKLHIVLNNDDLTGLGAITDRVIGDRDRLLVSYGDISDSQLQTEFKSVPSTAKHYDETKDPASCGAGAENVTTSDRLHHLF
ncbi:MAG TPA: hypothetical protein VLF40_04195 [Candidatus Saccharimonadales bacterium]|nr:hypothetical protein [Candidatus Saccharimonadales bacterium]